MGTSSSYGGPTGANPLLPSWAQPDAEVPSVTPADDTSSDTDDSPADDAPAEDSEDGNQSSTDPTINRPVDFRGAKSTMTRWVNGGGGGGRDGVGHVGRNYVAARGGARGAAAAAPAGRSSTANLGSFLSSVARSGLAATVRSLGLGELTGRSASEVFAEIANHLAPSGATLEEATARRAVDEALLSLFQRYELAEADLSELNRMDADGVRDAVELSVAAYIYYRWLQELSDRVEANAVSANQAVKLERQVKDYVRQTVRLDLREIDVLNVNWTGPDGGGLVERIYLEAYGLLEA